MKNLWLTGGIVLVLSTCTWAERIYDRPYLGKLGRPWDRFSARSLAAQAREGLPGVVAAADLIILGTAQGLRELRSGQPPDPDRVEAQEATVRVTRVLKGKTEQNEFKLRWIPSATGIRDGARHVFFLKLRKSADPLVQRAMYLYPQRPSTMRMVGLYNCSEDTGLAVLDHLINGTRPTGLPKKLLAEYQSSSYGYMYSGAVMAASVRIEIGQEVLKRVIAERRRGRFNFDLFSTAAHALAAKKGDEGLKLLLGNIPAPPGYGRMAESMVFDLVAAYGTTKLVPYLVKFARENPRYGVSAAFALVGIGGHQARQGIQALLADPAVSKRTEILRDFGTRRVPAADLLRQALTACRATTTKALVLLMTDKSASWDDRCSAEEKLISRPPQEVLPVLLPHVSKGMPAGYIWNSGGRESDKRAPVAWQVYYAVSRSWTNHVDKLPRESGGELLLRLLTKASEDKGKVRILHDLALRWTPRAEPSVADLLKNANQKITVRTTAGLALILHGKERYHETLLKFAGQGSHADRKKWYDLLADPRHKKRSGIDPRVVVLGFDLIEAEQRLLPDYVHGAYFLAVRTGDYVGHEFKPDQKHARYQGKHGLTDEFFKDTVRNALRWWKLNRGEMQKGLHPGVPAAAGKP